MNQKVNPDLQAAIDSRLTEAIVAANYRITLNTQKQNARFKLQKNLTYSINGGTFVITAELISFVNTLLSCSKEDAILLDVKNNPIEIENLRMFFENILDVYYECMNEFLIEFKTINTSRTVKALVGEQ